MDKIGSRIQAIRKRKGISITRLSEISEVAKSYISNVERGIQQNPSIQLLEKIADALHVPVNALLFDDFDSMQEQLDPELFQLVMDAMSSGISKKEFKEFLEYQKWKKNQDKDDM